MPWWIVENTLLAALLALLVALVSRPKRVPPVVRHGLWLVVLIKLIVPPVFSLGISVPGNWMLGHGVQDVFVGASANIIADPPGDLRPTLAGARAIQEFPENDVVISGLDAIDASTAPGWPGLERSEAPEGEESQWRATQGDLIPKPAEVHEDTRISIADHASSPPGLPKGSSPGHPLAAAQIDDSWPAISLANLLHWGVLAGSVLVTLVQIVRLVRLRRMLNRAGRASDEIVAFVTQLATELGVRAPSVRVSSEIASPLVCAVGPAVLLWPASRLASLRASARRAVIVHELAHLARRDHWIGWVELAASCAWWWNPLFWYVRHQLHENAELACDAWVTGLFPEARRAYAGALVDLAELDSLETATAPALGVGHGSRQLFERRLVMIMGERVRYRLGAVGFIGMGLLALVALPGCSASVAAVEPVLAESLPGQFLDVTAPPGLSAPGNVAADLFVDASIVQDPLQPTGTTPALGPQPIALDETFEMASPAAARPSSPSPDATRAQEPAAASDIDRLKRLEDRFDALLAELRELKTGSKARAVPATPALPSSPTGISVTTKAGKASAPGPGITTSPAFDMTFLAKRFKHRIAFEIGHTQTTDGGRIEIHEVWGTRPQIEIGGQYLVRGKYVLPPGEHGKLYFYATASGAWGQTSDLDLQSTAVDGQEGEFSLIHGLAGPGYFHLVLTDVEKYSRSFANVYFGTGDNVYRDPARARARPTGF